MMESQPVARAGRLKSLETLRGLAAIAVYLTHCGTNNNPVIRYVLGDNHFLGSIGVDVFFIISGYVMATVAFQSPGGALAAARFLLHRGLRIYPAYLFVTLVFVLLNGRILHLWPTLSELVHSALLVPERLGATGCFKDPIISLGWTLRFEIYFYGVVALGIALERRWLVPLALILLSYGLYRIKGFYFGAPIALEFLYGYFLYLILDREKTLSSSNRRAFTYGLWISVGLLLMASRGIDYGLDPQGSLTLVPRLFIKYPGGLLLPRAIVWGGPSAFLVYVCLRLENWRRWRWWGIGKFTYSFYLCQIIILTYGHGLLKGLNAYPILAFSRNALLLVVLAVLCNKFVENPPLNYARRFDSH
jgi:exopolysaccharide production protein ExoZ